GTPTTIEDRQDELTALYETTFPHEEKHEGGRVPLIIPFTPTEEWIIERARLMRGGNGTRFEHLWIGDASDFMRSDGTIDHSRADQALLGILAYWTRCNPTLMESLFVRSGLYRP